MITLNKLKHSQIPISKFQLAAVSFTVNKIPTPDITVIAYEIHEILLNEIRKTPVVFFVGSYLFILGANTAHVTIDPNQTDNPTTCMNFKITSIKKRLPLFNSFMIFI